MMHSRIAALSLLGALGLGLFAAIAALQSVGSAADRTGAQRWEHLALTVEAEKSVGDAETGAQIVKLGNEGWELVGVESFVKDGSTTRLVYFFKRPK